MLVYERPSNKFVVSMAEFLFREVSWKMVTECSLLTCKKWLFLSLLDQYLLLLTSQTHFGTGLWDKVWTRMNSGDLEKMWNLALKVCRAYTVQKNQKSAEQGILIDFSLLARVPQTCSYFGISTSNGIITTASTKTLHCDGVKNQEFRNEGTIG